MRFLAVLCSFARHVPVRGGTLPFGSTAAPVLPALLLPAVCAIDVGDFEKGPLRVSADAPNGVNVLDFDEDTSLHNNHPHLLKGAAPVTKTATKAQAKKAPVKSAGIAAPTHKATIDSSATAAAPADDASLANITSVGGFDCLELQETSATAPQILEGSFLKTVKEECDAGIISTAEDVAKELERLEGPNSNLDDQLEILANDLCKKYSTTDDKDLENIREACAEVPRNNEHVVDVAANLSEQSDGDTIELPDICRSLNENRTEIEAGVAVLGSRSEERRRLNNANDTQVSSFQVASSVVSMLDCYCDENNPMNEGCTRKQLQFTEAVSEAILEKAANDAINEDPGDVLSKVQSSLDKHTDNSRQRSSLEDSGNPGSYTKTENGLHESVERAMLKAGVGKCDPPGVQATPTGAYSLCLYAGPYFECDITFDPSAYSCLESSCGGGKVAKLVAAVKFCLHPNPKVELELKICVDVISTVLEILGKYVSSLESIMNGFGVYGGCYRLAWAQYDIPQQRMQVTIGPHRKKLILNVSLVVGGKAFMRFKGKSCNYRDSQTWMAYEYVAASSNAGYIGTSELNHKMKTGKHLFTSKKGVNCEYHMGPWVVFELSFGVEVNFLIDKLSWSKSVHIIAKSSNHNLCTDDDACVRSKPGWGGDWKCANSGNYCTSQNSGGKWARNMAECCKLSCAEVDPLSVKPRRGKSGCEANHANVCFDDDSCLQNRPGWHPYNTCAKSTGWCSGTYEHDMAKCCSLSCHKAGKDFGCHSMPACTDDDQCLKNRPGWNSDDTCAENTNWCTANEWQDDMLACCALSCGRKKGVYKRECYAPPGDLTIGKKEV